MSLFKSWILGIVCVAGLASAATAANVCPQCGRVHGNVVSPSNSLQARAQAEAQQMASRNYKGHIQGTLPGVNFCGVGWSSSSNPSTCTPSSSMTLVADAIARGSDGWYRVRYWR